MGTRAIYPQRLSHTWQPLGATKRRDPYILRGSRKKEMLRRRSSNVYCPHNGVLCREEDLTLSAVCSTCAQAHLAQIHLAQDQLDQDLLSNSTKDEVDSSSSTSITSTFSKKSKSKRTVTFMP